jgi:hypothetical protein
MKIRVENGKSVTSQKGRSYFSFWLRVTDGPFALGVAGWKYYPDTKTISSPSQLKGKVKSGGPKFINTSQPNPAFFNEVLAQAQAYFDGESLTNPVMEAEETE